MKNMIPLLSLSAIILTGCTTGSATRTSSQVYQPTDSSRVEILFEKPSRAYTVIGVVRCGADNFASDDSMYRSMQKEAAELGAHAILVQGGVDEQTNMYGQKVSASTRALAIRWKDGREASKPFAVTPTSATPTTQKEEQIIPKE